MQSFIREIVGQQLTGEKEVNGKIEVKNIGQIFKQGDNKVYALNDVSFSVAEGEFAVITGYSGRY